MKQNDDNHYSKKEKIRKNVSALINIILIVWILFTGFCYLLFVHRDTVSGEENRNLAKFPEFSLSAYLRGDYTAGIAHFYNDTVPYRSRYKKMIASKLLPLKGIGYGDDNVTIYGSAPEQPVTSAPPAVTAATGSSVTMTSASTSCTTVPATTEPQENDGEVTNNIVVANKRGMMLYGGGWGRELEYADFVNEYHRQLGDSVKVYSMVLPTSCSFYMPEKFKSLCSSEKEDFDRIAAALDGVTAVDAYSALEKHKDEHIYSRTDHHWQQLGAYYAAEAFAKAAGVPFDPMSNYDERTLTGYVGTLYGYTQSAELINNPEEFTYFTTKNTVYTTRYDTDFTNRRDEPLLLDPYNMLSSSYYMVFGSDETITHIHTSCENGRTLVIFKDSYGNALPSLLTGSFQDIFLCDIRYFQPDAIQFIKDRNTTDLLFAMCSFSAVGDNRFCIRNNIRR